MSQTLNDLVKKFHTALNELPTPDNTSVRVYFPDSEAHKHGSPIWELHKALERVLYVKNVPNSAMVRLFSKSIEMSVAVGKKNELEIFSPKGVIVHEHMEYL